MTSEELFDIIRPVILTVTGVPECIMADPNAPAPDGAYASVRTQQGLSQRGQANNYQRLIPNGPWTDVEKDARAQVIAQCSVNFYRGDALRFASKLFQANKRPDIQAHLFNNSVGWNRTSAVNNLTALQSDNYEQRAQIDIFLMYEESDPVVINEIASVGLTVLDDDNTVLYSE